MSLRLQIIILICFAIALLVIINMCRKKKMDLRQGLPWMVAIIILIIFDIFPILLTKLAELMGIGSPMNMMMFFGFAFLLIIIVVLTSNISKLNKKTTRLTQEVAILKAELEKEKNGSNDN